MRLDAKQHNHDPKFGPLCRRALILLDGKVQNFVIVADEEQGYIEKYVCDDRGRLELNRNGTATTERVRGAVMIVDPLGGYER